MSLLATRFSYRGLRKVCRDRPLNEIELRQCAPSVFAAEAHESRSQRYGFVPTIEIINGLALHGFRPFSACQSTSRIAGKSEFTKHLLRLRHADEIGTKGAKEVIIINSHDGTSSLQILGGWFESVCQNGLVVGKAGMDVRIKHSGDIIQETQTGAFEVLRTLKVIEENREEMLEINLCEDARRAFAKAALMLRYEPDEHGNSKAPIQAENLLAVRRREEQRDAHTLWRTMNVIQENATEGGIVGRDANRRRTTTRPVRGIDQSTALNKAIWALGEEMREILRRAA